MFPADLKDPLAPCVGLVLQRTHLVTGDNAHYVAMVQELEASRGKSHSRLCRWLRLFQTR